MTRRVGLVAPLVIVLNGTRVPGVGDVVAERVVPGRFRLVVAGPPTMCRRACARLLSVRSVPVSVSSGIAPVTMVVRKDLSSVG